MINAIRSLLNKKEIVKNALDSLSGKSQEIPSKDWDNLTINDVKEDLSNLKSFIVKKYSLKNNSFYFGFINKEKGRLVVYCFKQFLFFKWYLNTDCSFSKEYHSMDCILETPGSSKVNITEGLSTRFVFLYRSLTTRIESDNKEEILNKIVKIKI